MARWKPDARGRLLRAALDLFSTQGYEATTAAQIAERAGLTKTTLFRQFSDKREILFQGQDDSVETVAAAMRETAGDLAPLDALRAGVAALAEDHVPEQQEIGRRIDVLVATSSDLQERAAYKRSVITAALQAAMTDRVDDAGLAGALADIGVRAYYDGFAEWTAADPDASLPVIVHRHLDALFARLAPLISLAPPP